MLGSLKFKRETQLQETEVRVKAFDRERITPALVSEKINIPLIGVVTLEILRLKIDPTTGKAEELLLLLYPSMQW